MHKEIESVIKRLEAAQVTLQRDEVFTWEGMDAILDFVLIQARKMQDSTTHKETEGEG